MMNSGAAQDLASPSCHSFIRLETTETQLREELQLSEFKCWKLLSHLEQQHSTQMFQLLLSSHTKDWTQTEL